MHNNNSILVSVLMPAYNAGKYIRESIDSVLRQTHINFELIIVNDGSTDHTEDIIAAYSDRRIRLISQKNKGVAEALNTGLSVAKGKYVARADADDICMPNRFQIQIDFLEQNPDYVLVASDVDYMDEKGNFVFHFRNHEIGYTNYDIRERFSNYCPFIHSSVMFKTDLVRTLGGYNKHAIAFEDYFLWSKLLQHGKVCNLKTPLMKIRLNAASVTVDDRDYPKEFLSLKKKAIETGIITEEDGGLLKKYYQSINKKDKIISYYKLLAKKYLWENYDPTKARNSLLQVIKLKPLMVTTYILLLLTFLSKNMIFKLYKMTKKIN